MEPKKLVVLGLGQRGNIYAEFAKKYPEKFDLVAIIENDSKRLEYAKRTFPNAKIFNSYKKFLHEHIQADIVAIATQDEDHRDHSVAMMKAGYDLL